MPWLELPVVWFLLVGVLLAGYAILDGFDLGAGMLHLFVAKNDAERRTVVNAIGPVWDGNEVWLLTAGGALFAAFPKVYATVFSGLYLALMLVLTALVLRAVCLEFRGKVENPRWRRSWDVVFAASSLVPALLFGVAIGNILRGLPLSADQEFAGTFLGLLNPFALLTGALSVTMFLAQGAAWLQMKTAGAVRLRALAAGRKAWSAWLVVWFAVTMYSRAEASASWSAAGPALAWIVPLLFLAVMVALRRSWGAARPGAAFALSSLAIALLLATLGVALYPNLVPALGGTGGLTIWNASSTPLTLRVMLVVALAGMPLVLGYTVFIYTRFKGTVVIDEHSY
jgi:cytochrome bd ubiquinol oxidase subunit II